MADESKVDVEKLQQDYSKLDERAKRFEAMSVDLEKKLKRFEGVDLDKLKADSEALSTVMRDKASQNPDDLKKWQEATEAKIRTQYQAKIETTEAELQKVRGINREMLVVDKAMEKIGTRFNDDGHLFVKQYVRGQVDRDENGNFIVKDEKGEPRYSPSKPAEKLSLEEWADEIAGKHPSIAKASVPRGSAKPGEKIAGTTGVDVARYVRMSREEQLRLDPKDRADLAKAALAGVKYSRA